MPSRFVKKFLRTILISGVTIAPLAVVAADDLGGRHQYVVRVDSSLESMTVTARFADPVDSVSARSRDAGRYLTFARNCTDDSPLRIRNQRLMLPRSGLSCLEYGVDLRDAARVVEWAG